MHAEQVFLTFGEAAHKQFCHLQSLSFSSLPATKLSSQSEGLSHSLVVQIPREEFISYCNPMETCTSQQACLECTCIILPYPGERGPMGGAPYIGPRLGDGLIFEVSVSHLDTNECPGKLPMLSS